MGSRRVASIASSCLVALGIGGHAAASEYVVFDNGSPVVGSGYYAVSYALAADDFVLDGGQYVFKLTGVTVFLLERVDKAWDRKTVQWWILQDGSGLPGAVHASGLGQEVTVTAGPTSMLDPNNRTLTMSFRFSSPVRVENGRRYWLALHLAPTMSTDVVVMWDGTRPGRETPGLPNGDLVDGVPDFSGVNTPPWNRKDRAFQLLGDLHEPGYEDTSTYPSQRRHLHGVLAKWCHEEYESFHSKPELVCNFTWDSSVDLDVPNPWEDMGPGAGPRRVESAAGKATRSRREALRAEMFQLFRRGATPKAIADALSRISRVVEGAPLGPSFDDKAKASLTASLRSASKADLTLARALAEGMNAMELDARFSPSKPVAVGANAVVEMGGVASLAFHGIQEGKASLQLKTTPDLPKELRGSVLGWPFFTYHFGFDGKAAAGGHVDLTFDLRRIHFPGNLRDLRVIEIDGDAWRDVTVGVDPRRRLITARTARLADYVILAPPYVGQTAR